MSAVHALGSVNPVNAVDVRNYGARNKPLKTTYAPELFESNNYQENLVADKLVDPTSSTATPDLYRHLSRLVGEKRLAEALRNAEDNVRRSRQEDNVDRHTPERHSHHSRSARQVVKPVHSQLLEELYKELKNVNPDAAESLKLWQEASFVNIAPSSVGSAYGQTVANPGIAFVNRMV